MRVVRALKWVSREPKSRVVTLGNFDGVHIAHQAICRRVVESAVERQAEPAALTFHPHPAAVLAPSRAPDLLVGIKDRLALLGEAGIRLVVAQRFDLAFSRIEAEDFVRTALLERLGAIHVVVGHSVRFGRGRMGDDALLQRMAKLHGFTVDVVGPVVVDGVVVSSTAIRQAIVAGDVPRAARLLGREHFVNGRVIHGQNRGAGLGFPTANLRVHAGLLPADGVYAVRVMAEGREYGGVANLGTNPTFGVAARGLEAHLFDFEGNLYGRRLRLAFVKRLRAERKFPSPDALVEQIRRDVEGAKQALARQ